jgi:hypothetical protein
MTFADQLRSRTAAAKADGRTCCVEHIDYLYKRLLSASNATKSSITVTSADLSTVACVDKDTMADLAEYARNIWKVTADAGDGAGTSYLRISW